MKKLRRYGEKEMKKYDTLGSKYVNCPMGTILDVEYLTVFCYYYGLVSVEQCKDCEHGKKNGIGIKMEK